MLSRKKIVFAENKLILKFFNLKTEEEQNGVNGRNLIEDNNILFIHNPKVAGNSLTNILSGRDEKLQTSHKTPTFLVTPKSWEKYTSVVAIRHPIDRLVSSFHYHTKAEYQGVFKKKYPGLSQFSFEQYFDVFSKEPYVIMPQGYYTQHFLSKKPVDFLLRFESLSKDVEIMAGKLNLEFKGLPHLNASKRETKGYFESIKLQNRVFRYYKNDFSNFDYEPNFDAY